MKSLYTTMTKNYIGHLNFHKAEDKDVRNLFSYQALHSKYWHGDTKSDNDVVLWSMTRY